MPNGLVNRLYTVVTNRRMGRPQECPLMPRVERTPSSLVGAATARVTTKYQRLTLRSVRCVHPGRVARPHVS